ncbi:glutamate--tRNA ligase 1 [Aliidongia dinghuensis]|uniref:Glutamate--tRNA ligase n=1 Tax=Aliidongia dinghuensis TaxID=1867774 RepID=A0A8J3E5F5_9PROT|nr:glutamate--tRNA ligase [Aliidongia dinghuensis]GGF34989.1 glutamate--tRNA ligase 1 [Aliidongia dinghuensis]
MTPILRFAPSPTGRLHLGNVRTAIVNWLYARKSGGRLMLRIDDTDLERSTAEHAVAIETDLKWLGLTWDLFVRQSDRFAEYAAAADKLRASGRLYPCFETPEELELKRKLALSRGRPPIYDRAALKLTPKEIADKLAAGEKPTWRFKLERGTTAWTDLVRGPVEIQAGSMSDPVLIKADGQPLYTLSSVVDDIAFEITHIIRGEDHVANTAVQIQLFEALGGKVPTFAHFSLIADAQGGKLSKRAGAISLENLRDDGIEPMSILSLLAKLGTSDPIELRTDQTQLVGEFDIAKFGRSQPKLDIVELEHLNAKLMHALPFEAVADRLPAGADAAFWDAVRGNLLRLSDAGVWWQVVHGEITPDVNDRDFMATAAGLLPAGPFDGDSWARWTEAVKAETGRKGRSLFLPLRLALTGLDHGPELARLLPLIGRDKALKRLEGHAA